MMKTIEFGPPNKNTSHWYNGVCYIETCWYNILLKAFKREVGIEFVMITITELTKNHGFFHENVAECEWKSRVICHFIPNLWWLPIELQKWITRYYNFEHDFEQTSSTTVFNFICRNDIQQTNYIDCYNQCIVRSWFFLLNRVHF